VFDIDLTKYTLVDLSLEVVPNQGNEERPFEVKPGTLPDGTNRFDIVNTHTHVGTHVESPWHFYGEGKTCVDYPLEYFMGKAALLESAIPEAGDAIGLAYVREQLESRKGQFEILFIRNRTGRKPVTYSMECVPYFLELGIKMLVFESTIEFGKGIEDGRAFHDVLMSRDVLLVEFPDGAEALDRDMFYLFAVPIRVSQLDSSPCRLFAVVER